MKYILKGEIIGLRALTGSDIDGPYLHWLNDPEITKFNSHGRFPQNRESLTSYVNSVQQSKNVLVLAVIDLASERHIGNISLQAINYIDSNAEIAFLLGEKDFHGRGIMYEAGKLLIDHAYNSLKLHRIYCGTSSANKGMLRLAEKLGMDKEGVRRDAFFNQGNYFDAIEFGMINPAHSTATEK